MRYGSLAGWRYSAFLMLPRFADIFQQGNRWLNWLEKQPVQMSRLEHYAGQDEIGLRYNSHRTKREENLVMSGDEFMERFSWHVADKGFRMVIRSPESGEAAITGRCGVRHNGDSEKNGEANHKERDVSAVTEG